MQQPTDQLAPQQYHRTSTPNLANNPLRNQQGTRITPKSKPMPQPQVKDVLMWQDFFAARPELKPLAIKQNEANLRILRQEIEKWKKTQELYKDHKESCVDY